MPQTNSFNPSKPSKSSSSISVIGVVVGLVLFAAGLYAMGTAFAYENLGLPIFAAGIVLVSLAYLLPMHIFVRIDGQHTDHRDVRGADGRTSRFNGVGVDVYSPANAPQQVSSH
ncbi:hypothetical protein LWF01_03195 [Saxibacter everestensis]|uniref:Uncharacterized protein n=1 Tax=Saxibacter everestensis TaxID=2909229 RepID=A0ABY8QWN7_9MICO|nr:hypothetical protein LWF01_03195 [Brevibacteriaceae bacterium ZFBP1038]